MLTVNLRNRFGQHLPARASRTKSRISGQTVALAVVLALGPLAAMAGTDTTFNAVVTMVSGWLEGSLGQVLALAGFGIALAAGLVKGSLMGVVSGLALALAATYGPTVLMGLFTGTF